MKLNGYIDDLGMPVREGLLELNTVINFPHNEALLYMPLEIANAFIEEANKYQTARKKEIKE